MFYSGYLKSSTKDLRDKINLGIVIDENISDIKINYIMNDIKKISKELKFISMSRTNETTNINLDIKPRKFEDLTSVTEKIKKRFKSSKVILSYNDDLSL
tara:strand:- start:284 stop:583 length:300 start_codon:yes stop_codon:yes gene_type:complete